MNRTALLCCVLLALNVVLVSSMFMSGGGEGGGGNGKLAPKDIKWFDRIKRHADMKAAMKRDRWMNKVQT